MLEVRGLHVSYGEIRALKGVSFQVNEGEVVALLGNNGAGKTTTLRAISGLLAPRAGDVIFEGGSLVGVASHLIVRRGVTHVPEGRRIFNRLSVLENLYLNSVARGISPFQPVGHRREYSACRKALARFSVKPPDPMRPIDTLSGGNQQKVVVARWMEAEVRLLILEEPTIGVDVGARADIYKLIASALQSGLSVLMLSTDLEEVENISHRALVFNRGRIVAELEGDSLTMSELVRTSSGG